MNNYCLVGKVIDEPESCQTQGGLKYLKVKLEVDKYYKDSEGKEIYEITLWGTLAEEKINEGELISVKGHMSANSYEKENRTFYNCSLIAEKISRIC